MVLTTLDRKKNYSNSNTTIKNFYTHLIFYMYIQIYELPWWLSGKESTCQAADADPIPGSISPEGGNGTPLQYSFLGNPRDREAWQAIVHGVAKNQT